MSWKSRYTYLNSYASCRTSPSPVLMSPNNPNSARELQNPVRWGLQGRILCGIRFAQILRVCPPSKIRLTFTPLTWRTPAPPAQHAQLETLPVGRHQSPDRGIASKDNGTAVSRPDSLSVSLHLDILARLGLAATATAKKLRAWPMLYPRTL